MGDEKSEMSDEVAARAESGWVGGGKGRTMHTENQEGLDYRACQRPRASGRAATAARRSVRQKMDVHWGGVEDRLGEGECG